jgi:hypothetical protein
MTGSNSMQSHRGRPKTETGKGAVVHPHIGGMETLGPRPVGGVTMKHKEGSAEKRHNAGKDAAHKALGFGKGPKLHKGVGGLKK